MNADAVDSSARVRTSDAERERVVRKLQLEFAVGRLTMAELEQRLGAAQAGAGIDITRGELIDHLRPLDVRGHP